MRIALHSVWLLLRARHAPVAHALDCIALLVLTSHYLHTTKQTFSYISLLVESVARSTCSSARKAAGKPNVDFRSL